MTVYHADGVMSKLERNTVRLRSQLPPNSARHCGGACGGEAVEETVRQWVDGGWYDVVWIRCLNITPMPREVRLRMRAERDIPAGKPIKCNWRHEVSRVARPDIPPPTLQTKVEVPQMATKTKKAPPCPRCGGNGEKFRTSKGVSDVCKDCIRAKMSESAKKRCDRDAERREHSKRLAAQEAEQVFEVEMAEAALADEQLVTERDIPVHAQTEARDVLGSVIEQLLTMSLGDLMRRKQPVRVAVFALLQACGEVDDEWEREQRDGGRG